MLGQPTRNIVPFADVFSALIEFLFLYDPNK